MSNRAVALRNAAQVLDTQGLYCSVLPGAVPMVHTGVRTRSTPKTGREDGKQVLKKGQKKKQ